MTDSTPASARPVTTDGLTRASRAISAAVRGGAPCMAASTRLRAAVMRTGGPAPASGASPGRAKARTAFGGSSAERTLIAIRSTAPGGVRV